MGVAEEERNTASVPVMAAGEFSQPQALGYSSMPIATPVIKPAREMVAAPVRAHIMAVTSTLCHVKSRLS